MEQSIQEQFEQEQKEKNELIQGLPPEVFEHERDFENKFRVYIDMSSNQTPTDQYFQSTFTQKIKKDLLPVEDTLNKVSNLYMIDEYTTNYHTNSYNPVQIKQQTHNYYDQIVKKQYVHNPTVIRPISKTNI